MEKYIIITWPEIQELTEKEGFEENTHIINDEPGLNEYGDCAYFVNLNWYNKITNNMEKEKFYLLTTLIEYSDSVSDGHSLFGSLDKAKEAMTQEIAECKENFCDDIEVVIDLPRCQEWRNQEGQGFTITIEEVMPL